MKRWGILLIIMLVAGVLFGQMMLKGPGYILIALPGNTTTVEMSLWVGAVGLFLLFIVLYFGLRLLEGAGNSVRDLRRWQVERRQQRALEHHVRGMLELNQGRWKNAQKLLEQSAKHSPAGTLAYLGAAEAAQRLNTPEAADEYLRLAQQEGSQQTHKDIRGVRVAVELTRARLQLERQQNQQALATLTQLREIAPDQPEVLKLQSQVLQRLQQWQALLGLLPDLRAQNLISDQEDQRLERMGYLGLLNAQIDANQQQQKVSAEVKETWRRLPSYLKADAQVVRLYVAHLLAYQAFDDAEAALRQALETRWCADLLEEYGVLPVKANPKVRLQQIAHWLEARPQDADLLLAAGRIALQAHQWQQAQEYLEASYRQQPDSVRCAELSRLYASLGDEQKSLELHRQGLLDVQRRLPELPQPSKAVVK
ncbi:HemY protein [Allopseudospirillum japonicum]|uniref:HemY protein n=1 Tax=Allopseudospirillum japonicum TaxID=64971 RepID=A0A1H6R9Q7_9GAMM|nr:heme biosynthesis HemY N-terminal domain-containing protein [Allopseudospirillum japonicum]SEI52483.1 HemY protein [Allopseudospirillum japonicum]